MIVATFGDLLRVPGTRESLLSSKASGARVEMVYSPLDALKIASDNPFCRVVFLGIGFETTAPAVAASIAEAVSSGLDNYSVLSMHKLTPPAMRAIVESHEIALDGILCPGHVSIVTGWKAWRFLPRLPIIYLPRWPVLSRSISSGASQKSCASVKKASPASRTRTPGV